MYLSLQSNGLACLFFGCIVGIMSEIETPRSTFLGMWCYAGKNLGFQKGSNLYNLYILFLAKVFKILLYVERPLPHPQCKGTFV